MGEGDGFAYIKARQPGKAMEHARNNRSVTRFEMALFEAAMTMVFSDDLASRWAWPASLQDRNILKPHDNTAVVKIAVLVASHSGKLQLHNHHAIRGSK